MHTIYKITEKSTGKCYVGQSSVKRGAIYRFHYHCSPSGKNPFIREIVKNEGKSALSFSILHKVESQEDANQKEVECIIKHKSLWPDGFNCQSGGVKKWKNTQYVKNKTSKTLTGKPQGWQNVSVYVDDIGEFFETVKDCAEHLGASSASVSRCLKKGWKVKGYSVRYSNVIL